MPAKLHALCSVALWLAPVSANAQSGDTASLQTCRVLETAYTEAVGSNAPAYPLDIRPAEARHSLALDKFVPESSTRQALTVGEFDDLKAQAPRFDIKAFRPLCVPSVKPLRKVDEQGHVQLVSFTSPIFSSDGRLALVEISFDEGFFGYGLICIVRRADGAWSARCHSSWIS